MRCLTTGRSKVDTHKPGDAHLGLLHQDRLQVTVQGAEIDLALFDGVLHHGQADVGFVCVFHVLRGQGHGWVVGLPSTDGVERGAAQLQVHADRLLRSQFLSNRQRFGLGRVQQFGQTPLLLVLTALNVGAKALGESGLHVVHRAGAVQ